MLLYTAKKYILLFWQCDNDGTIFLTIFIDNINYNIKQTCLLIVTISNKAMRRSSGEFVELLFNRVFPFQCSNRVIDGSISLPI